MKSACQMMGFYEVVCAASCVQDWRVSGMGLLASGMCSAEC